VRAWKKGFSGAIIVPIVLANVLSLGVRAAAHTASPDGQRADDLAEPEIALTRADFGVDVADREGSTIASFGDLADRYSLDGNVLAGARTRDGKRNVVVFNATTKERLAVIRDALTPVVFKGGRKLLFDGDGNRDKYSNSLWVRNLDTRRTRRIVRFSVGGGTPGIKTGFGGENLMLEKVVDRAGRTAVVVQGNDLDLFIYDVWSIDLRTGNATRLTRGQRSRHASISPDGTQISLLREDVDGFCGGPAPGYRAGDIVVMGPDASHKRVLVDGNCEDFYDQPRWLDDSTLVARRLTHVEGEEFYDSELVFIDVPSGMPTEPFTMTTSVGNFTVSSEMGVVAYDDFMTASGFFVYDSASTQIFPSGRFPHLKGENISLF
jgi:hypothetical protein